jgi:hypothetical protein
LCVAAIAAPHSSFTSLTKLGHTQSESCIPETQRLKKQLPGAIARALRPNCPVRASGSPTLKTSPEKRQSSHRRPTGNLISRQVGRGGNP